MAVKPVELHVCITCRGNETPEAAERPGARLYKEMRKMLEMRATPHVRLHPVECLSVCTRPCTVAVASAGKWSYVIGGLDAAAHVNDLCRYLELYAASEDGVPAFRQRPEAIRRGAVARIPPFA